MTTVLVWLGIGAMDSGVLVSHLEGLLVGGTGQVVIFGRLEARVVAHVLHLFVFLSSAISRLWAYLALSKLLD